MKHRITKQDILLNGNELNKQYDSFKNCKDEKEKKKQWEKFKIANQEYRELFERYIQHSNDISGLL